MLAHLDMINDDLKITLKKVIFHSGGSPKKWYADMSLRLKEVAESDLKLTKI